MLVLTRKLNQSIVIGGNITVTVVGIRGNQVRLGITAPETLGIYRDELCSPDSEKNAARRSREDADLVQTVS